MKQGTVSLKLNNCKTGNGIVLAYRETENMKLIIDRYAEIKDKTEFDDSKDKLIVECFKYKIFKDKPSKRFLADFKDDFDYDYPIYISDITKKMMSKLRARIKFYKDEEAFEEKARKQRALRGYADVDVWNMDSWFMETMSPMLKQFRKTHHGVPSSFSGFDSSPEEWEAANAKWEEILDRLIFLIEEMNADKCSMKNPYKRIYEGLDRKFIKEMGRFGEKAKSPEEKAKEEAEDSYRMYFPTDFPDKYPTAEEIENKYFEYEKKIDEYRDKCKDEFFLLFSKYFWMLWD